jgi:branched-chain amino acid transport system ATP-binding protein
MAFMTSPRLLIIDELSLGLAPAVVEQLLGAVRAMRARGVTVLLVEQSVNVALNVAERAYFMEKGEVRFEGPTRELLQRDDIVRSVFLEGARGGVASTASGGDGGELRAVAEVVLSGRGAGVSRGARDGAADEGAGAPALATRDVSVSFGGIRAVAGVSVSVNSGEILGIIGPNGAGKTTLFDVLSGFVRPSTGRVLLRGRDVTDLSPDARAWLGLGRSFQDARIFPAMTVAENLATALERHLPVRDHAAAALCLPRVRDAEEDAAWAVADLIELMSLQAYRDKFVRELSTGSRRIVDLAMVLAHDPDVLILDEPSSGIAQREAEALAPLLHHIRAQTGCALLVIEHDIPLVTAVSDRMVAMELGRVIAEGPPQQVIRDPLVVASYLGTDEGTINRSAAAAEVVAVP